MAQVFVSYKSDDRADVQLLVQALRTEGLSVWWDQDITPGAPWEGVIERELSAANAAIVAWSPRSVASEKVRAEAREALDADKLIPVLLEPCEPPLFFRERQSVSLVGWSGTSNDHHFRALVAALQEVIAGKAPTLGAGYAPKPKRRFPLAATGGLVAFLAISLLAIFCFLANVGSSRGVLCDISVAKGACKRVGSAPPVPPIDPSAAAALARTRLIRAVAGSWGRQDRSCADRIEVSVATDADDVWRITVTSVEGVASTGQVIAADNGVVVSRNTTPNAKGPREQWEYRPNGDEMTVVDKNGVSTTLVRCPTPA